MPSNYYTKKQVKEISQFPLGLTCKKFESMVCRGSTNPHPKRGNCEIPLTENIVDSMLSTLLLDSLVCGGDVWR